ncbi:hypothetical protein O6H91_22G056800 [Diphasiastrum complanatum]|uniref:Uncharacterized protein n=1 Tax=Diphasiastrum complanatum TaxID=34168 RepID=A0ACC2AG23_DIPCM|nr:hypothetical protein O6H91_22G056800 [Diphasiastrum complanatum]
MATYSLCRLAVPASTAQCMINAGPDELICRKASSGVGPSSHASLASSQAHSRSRRRKGLGSAIKHRWLGERVDYDLQRLILVDRKLPGLSLRQDQRLISSQIGSAHICGTHKRSSRKQVRCGWMRVPGVLYKDADGYTLTKFNQQSLLRSVYQPTRRIASTLRASGVQNEPHATNLTTFPEKAVETVKDPIENHARDVEIKNFLNSKLPSHPKLHRGQLDNGLRYVILPNKVPPNRFEAHMEMHVGSVDEAEHEQGIAHMIEHVAFLGSKKREKLLGTGARSNAYTDFHHTVFHVHSPVTAQGSNEPLLPLVLDALHEIAFKPKFLLSRIEKERRAILSELQMMNTIEYRVDCQLLQQLHSENLLGYRFPIGLEEQIKNWDPETIKAFHERWYYPANATLFIVGDIGSIGRTIEMIEAQFRSTPAGMHYPVASHSTASMTGLNAHLQIPKLQRQVTAVVAEPLPIPSLPTPIRKERHALRPPVKHNWSLPGTSVMVKRPHIFQHELLQNVSISLFSKTPVKRVQTFSDLRDVLMRRIVLSTFQFRINTRYKSANPPFNGIELDHSDSGREGCTVTTLTVMCEPKHWVGALKVAIQEAKRLSKYGVTKGELARYSNALLKDSEHLAAMIDNVPSVDNLDFIMESDALGHTIMDQQQGHESLLAVANSVTLEDVHAVARAMLEYIAEFGKLTAPVPTAIVACVPRTLHENGIGDVQFCISPEEIVETMVDGLNETLIPEPELEVPKELVSPIQLANLHMERKPSFVPVTDGGMLLKVVNDATGVVLRRLSNGIRVNYKNEAKGGVMRLVVAGGRARETPDTSGAVAVGVRTLSEGGVVGGFSREQVELFCVSNLINCVLEADEEFICMDFHFTVRDGGMCAAFQLLHMVLEHNVWLEEALDRAKQLYLSHYRAMPKSLERATAHHLMRAMLGGEERFIEPSPQTIEKLTLPVVRTAVMEQLVTGNMEVCVVGDFSEGEVEACILDYLGTLTPERNPQIRKDAETSEKAVIIKPCPHVELRNQKVLLKDTDERACAYIAGTAPNRWGFTSDGRDLNTLIEPVPSTLIEEKARALAPPGVELLTGDGGVLFWKRPRHHLYGSIAMTLLAEIINARLFTTVRDALGLTYDVSFELSLFDRLKAGWFVISVTSTPAKINLAVEASLNVLKGLHGNRITQRELDRAKRTLMMRHESDSKDNTYWLGLLTHLQAPSVMRKNVSCIRDLPYLYELATADDVYKAYDYLGLDNDSLYTCIGISGIEATNGSSHVEVEQENYDLESVGGLQGALLHGRGMSTMTRPTT